MKTKVPFAGRAALLAALMLGVSSVAAVRLAELQIFDTGNHRPAAVDDLIDTESIPAQRGIIMDRNEELLTNNIQSAELVADRYHLREITAVVEGLAHNHAVNDPRWESLTDPKERRKLVYNYRAKLLNNAKADMTDEEKAERRARINPKDAKANRLMEYDEEVMEYYFRQHDKLVAEVLYPFLSHQEIEETINGRTIKRFMTREDIVEKIAQTATQKYNEEAKAKGLPTRSIRNQIVLAKGMSFDTADKIRKAVSEARVRGLMVQSDLRRSYVMPEMLCHVLGYVDHENKGMSGVEAYFQSYLAGVDGFREYRHNARGQVLPNEDDRYMAPKHGLNIKLTIDMRLQTIVEQELDKGMRHFRAKRGCMIVVDPKTGDILAMVSRPAFDLNTKELITHKGKFPRGEVKDDNGKVLTGDFNFACQTRYEPGSTFKVLAVTTVVDKGLMGIGGYVNCEPFSVGFGSRPISDRPFNYHSLPVWGVLKKSSNPGAARIAIVGKWQNFKEYLEKFGLNKPAGLELPSGGACLLADGSNIVNYSRIAYGYSVAVSPLHMAMVYATIANDGVRMKPRLIDKIIAADGAVYDECAPQEICRVMKSSTAKDLRFALESVTQRSGECGRGTATAAAIPGFRIGGKTGTAKKVKDGGGYTENLYTVSFAGVLPIDDPKLVVMTVIDEPHPTDCNPGGGTVAAPIFRAAAERFINVLNLTPSDPEAYEKYLATKEESANLKK
ncbi:MAG: penicillin-binding protein 2 [Akkermansia sp.]|nr:penicillin-binding protein 2 [Akkermansia sp.]MBQ8377375.1 penicillin-binding protein 2 [Akkermansia sp.]